MSLSEKLDRDLKIAMAAKDAEKLSVLRFLKSAVKYAAIEKKVAVLGDAETQLVIQKQIKQRRESVEQFTKGGRADLAAKEAAELKILENYLPKQLDDAELERLVKNEVAAAGVTSKKDFGRMMKLLNEKLQGQAEPARVSQALGKILT